MSNTTNHVWLSLRNSYNACVNGKQYVYSINRYGRKYAYQLASLSLKYNRKFWDYYTENDNEVTFYVFTHKYGIVDVLIDKDDFELISQYKISISNDNHAHTFYARTKCGAVHLLIMKPPKGLVVDHINGNGLDNRKVNLRVVTVSTNNKNSGLRSDNKTSVRGVCKSKNRYRAFWYDNNKKKHSKSFSILKYGEEKAFSLATQFRLDMELKYGYLPVNRSTTIPSGSTI